MAEGNIKDRVRQARKARALTQAELAKMAGLSTDGVVRIESGRSNPRPDSVQGLARALDVSVEYLTTGQSGVTATLTASARPADADLTEMIAEARRESESTGGYFDQILAAKLDDKHRSSGAVRRLPVGTPRSVRPRFSEPVAAAAVSSDR